MGESGEVTTRMLARARLFLIALLVSCTSALSSSASVDLISREGAECSQKWCTGGLEGNNCWAAPGIDTHARCTCSQGAARLTGQTYTDSANPPQNHYEYTCCISGQNVGELCSEPLAFFGRSLSSAAASNATNDPRAFIYHIRLEAGPKPEDISWRLECPKQGLVVEGGAPHDAPVVSTDFQLCDLYLFDKSEDAIVE